MMFHVQGPPRNQCKLLAVLSGSTVDSKPKLQQLVSEKSRYPFPQLVSSGRLEVQILINPTTQEFQQAHELSQPNIVYLQGEQLQDCEDIGSLVLGDVSVTSEDALCELFGSALPTTIYLEISNGEKLAEALRSKGTPYVIYWEKTFSLYAACHFRQSLFSVVQSSCTHTWDAFQLAHASFRLYCLRNNNASPTKSQREMDKQGPCLLGDPPKIDVVLPEADPGDQEGSLESLPAIKIYDDDVSMRFLICGGPCTVDACLLGSLEDGLNALLSIEIRGSKLHNRSSAPPPPLQAGTFSRSVVTMRCDLSTCSSAHISLLVSGNAQTCFNDDILENHIKNELIEKGKLVQASCERKMPASEPRKSASVACGASVFEVCFKVPAWSSQVLRQLAPDLSYRSLVALGIASIQGLPVASFEKDDAVRLLFFCKSKELYQRDSVLTRHPSWLVPPVPRRKRDNESRQETLPPITSDLKDENGCFLIPKFKIAAMRPIPRTRNQNLVSFSGVAEADRHDIDQPKRNTGCGIVGSAPANRAIVCPTPVTHRKSMSCFYQSQQIISLNPLPLKKHGCSRSPILDCLEEEFLRDVMQFLILRGHNRLIPQGGLAEFPEAVLNATRLDLYSLYREVVSRGGFHVGNGINWKGQVFSKMRNFTLTHRMTGVGNTLKRHYETYLLEYELAHDDVDGECCLVCHSSAGGDWVNCETCGEWAHFGCDRRQGLGAFKDYAKTDGLEYMCPLCSVTNFKQKSQKITNGY